MEEVLKLLSVRDDVTAVRVRPDGTVDVYVRESVERSYDGIVRLFKLHAPDVHGRVLDPESHPAPGCLPADTIH